MPRTRYQRTLNELHERAAMFWSSDLLRQEADSSVIPRLIESQDSFIDILSFPVADHTKIFELVEMSTMPTVLFLKHLMVLADVGGEKFSRYNNEFLSIFPDRELRYIRDGVVHTYQFAALPTRQRLNNSALGVDGKNFFRTLRAIEENPEVMSTELSGLMRDVITILMFGSASERQETADILVKCEIGNYVGQREKLDEYVRQRYIWVSRITGGAQANTLGQLAQKYVKDYLASKLPQYDFTKKRIPGIRQSTDKDTSFDVIVTNGTRYVAIEVSFQVTTNSVIERKSGQAKDRFEQIDLGGHKIAYVIDGAGNFQREAAVSNICSFSHCTVAFTDAELDVLAEFILEFFEK